MTNHTALLPVEQIDREAAEELCAALLEGQSNYDVAQAFARFRHRLAAHRLQAPAEAGERDNCEMCLGVKGGIKGNENRILGIVMCDYCHAKVLPALAGAAGEVVDQAEGAAQWLDLMADRFEYEWPNTAKHCRLHVNSLRAAITALRAKAPEARGEVERS